MSHDDIEVSVLRLPAQHALGALAVGDEARGVAGAARALLHFYVPAGDAARGVDDLLHREAVAVAEVEGVAVAACGEAVQRQQVGLTQVADVDVVADAGAVGGVVVAAEHGDVGAAPGCCLQHQGDEVGFGLVALAQLAFGVGAGGVEVAQAHGLEAEGAVVAGQRLFHHPFGDAVGVDGARGVGFVDGHVVGLAEDGGGGREDEALHIVRDHGVEQVEGVAEVVAVVEVGPRYRFAHLDGGGEVHDAAEGVAPEEPVQRGAVGKVGVDEFAADNGIAMAGGKVVEGNDLAAGAQQQLDHVRADVAGAADDEDGVHFKFQVSSRKFQVASHVAGPDWTGSPSRIAVAPAFPPPGLPHGWGRSRSSAPGTARRAPPCLPHGWGGVDVPSPQAGRARVGNAFAISSRSQPPPQVREGRIVPPTGMGE